MGIRNNRALPPSGIGDSLVAADPPDVDLLCRLLIAYAVQKATLTSKRAQQGGFLSDRDLLYLQALNTAQERARLRISFLGYCEPASEPSFITLH